MTTLTKLRLFISCEPKTKEFIEEVRRDGYKYVRFHDRKDLKPAVRSALYAVLNKEFRLEATSEESVDGEHLIEAASSFEAAPMRGVATQALDTAAPASFVDAVGRKNWVLAESGLQF